MHSRLHAEIVAHLPHGTRGYGSLIVKTRGLCTNAARGNRFQCSKNFFAMWQVRDA
jgi:hypothetical protein